MKNENEGVGKGTEQSESKKKHYEVMVDKTPYKVEVECMTGAQILEMAEKMPFSRFQLNVRYRGGKVSKVSYEEKICFSDPGIEKFMTIPLDQTEGGK